MAVAAGAASLAVAVGAAAARPGPGPRVSAPFTLASGFQQDYGVGPSALGPDGTVWLAQAGYGASPAAGFEIIARAADGRSLRPVATSDGAGSATDRPAIAATPGRATFAWQTATNVGGSSGTASVRARSCTLAGCGPVQVLSRWSWSSHGAVGGSGFTGVGDAEPALAAAGGHVIAVFFHDGGGARRMQWTVAAGGGRFGPVRALSGPGGPNPALAADATGGVVAAWIAGDLAAYGSGIDWAVWSPRDGFSRPRALAGAGATDSDLVAAPAGSGVALAWLQGANVSDPVPAEPLWVARRGAGGGFARPVRVFAGDAYGLSLAGASNALALAFSATTGPRAESLGPGPAWVKRSVAGRPFGAAVDLDPTAAAPGVVAVAPGGAVLAAWEACRAPPSGGGGGGACAAQLALARPDGGFGAPATLGSEVRGDAPALLAAGGRAAVVWASGAAVVAVLVSP